MGDFVGVAAVSSKMMVVANERAALFVSNKRKQLSSNKKMNQIRRVFC